MGTKSNEIAGKYSKPLQKIFNARRQMLKAKSLMNLLEVDKNEDIDDQECQHLLENTEEVSALNTKCFLFNKKFLLVIFYDITLILPICFQFLKQLSESAHERNTKKEKQQVQKFELLKNFTIAKVSVSDRDRHCSWRRNNNQNTKAVQKDDNDGTNDLTETGKSPLQRTHSMLNLTEVEKLQLRFVLTQQNCADCGLW